MKKLLILVIGLSLILISNSIKAASVGGKQPEQGKFKIGFEYNLITEKDLTGSPPISGGIKLTESNQYLAKIEYGILSSDIYKWSGFVKLGAADRESETADVKYPFDEEFAYGIGSKFSHNFDLCTLGIEAQYFFLEDTSMTKSGSIYSFEDWKEWQISLFAMKDFEFENFILTPYLGIKYSDLKADGKGGTWEGDVEADENFGVFLGLDLGLTENISLDLEGRFIDEEAFTVGLSYNF
ncbi:hypothetical protein J7L36_00320 [bacterium]|nr:hypothetical protein [bacterium]